MTEYKRYRKGQFEFIDKCPKCKKKLKYDTMFPRHLLGLIILDEYKIIVPRRRMVGVARCCRQDWFKLK